MPLNEATQPTRLSGAPRDTPEVAHTAALANVRQLRNRMRNQMAGPADWQHQVIEIDRDGPGILGYYLDTVALLASLCPLVPAELDGTGKWVRSDDAILNAIAWGYRSPLFEQHELVSMHVRAREGVGEAWIIWSDQIGWHIATVPNVVTQVGGDGSVQWSDLFGVQRRTPSAHVHKSWCPDPYEPWMPTSPVRRALPDLRRLRSAVRSQMRAAESRLVMNGLIAFSGEGEVRPFRTDEQQTHEGVDEIIEDYFDLAQKAFTNDDTVAAHVPFPYIGPKAEYVEVGRGIDERVMEMEDRAIEAFARHVNFPAQLLTDGPGNANHWNEWILQEIQHKLGLAPKLMPVCGDISAVYFRPAVQLMNGRLSSWQKDPARVRLEPDYTFLATKPDKAAKALDAYTKGLIGREEAVHEMGFAEMMPLPAGLSEYEHWELASGNKGAPYVAVDSSGRAVETGQTGPREGPRPDEAQDELMPGEPAGDGEMPLVDTSRLTLPGGGDDPSEVPAAPPEPPAALTAALSADEREERDRAEGLLAALVAAEAGATTALNAVSSAAAAAALREVAKAVIKAYPAEHPDRRKLRELPAEQVWAQADPQVRATVDVEAVVAEALEPYEPQFTQVLEDLAERTGEAHSDAGSIVPEILIAAALAALLAGLIQHVVGWAKLPEGLTATGDVKPFRKGAVRVPDSVVRNALTIAGGAAADMFGNPRKGRSGAPLPDAGGVWEGGAGAAIGHNSISAVNVPPGYRIVLRWVHGFTRTPADPYPPHVELDGRDFDSLSAVPGGFFPGDHPWCSCAALPRLVRNTGGVT